MSRNDNMPVQPMHTEFKFGEAPTHIVRESLNAIDVSIYGAPTIDQFREIVSVFMMNTWNDRLQAAFDDGAINQCIKDLFAGNILPTGMETINLTWSLEGINMIDTTHLIRHRLFSFSAQTHADRDMRHDVALMPAGIQANQDFSSRFYQIVKESRKLYADMMDSGEVHCLDARTIMPRCFEHFYVTRSTLKDIISFCQMRGDEQIQTAADNIIAMKLWLKVLRLYPFLKGVVDFRTQDKFYIKQCSEGKTNIFPPNEKNDTFEWSAAQFFHTRHRDEFPGGDVYLRLRNELLKQIDAI